MTRRVTASTLCALLGCLTATAQAEPVSIWFYSGPLLTQVQRNADPGQPPAEAALQALAAGPTSDEQAAGLLSAIPAGTSIASISSDGASITIDFSPQLAAGLSELAMEQIYRQVQWTLRPFGLDSDIRLTVNGTLLSDYLPPAPTIAPAVPKNLAGAALAGPMASLAGRSITLSPGHGYMWNGGSWVTQRPVYCSPLNQEDFHNLEMCQYLETYLKADGMTVRLVRCTDKNFGNYAAANKPWWQMAGYTWLKQIGYPCSVYASSTGDCNLGSGGTESGDDIRARPLASDQDGSDIYVSLHTNGFSGDCTGSCPTGSETYYDAGTEHATWGAVSQTLATNINTSLMSAITAHVDSSWTCHGTCVKNSNGNYGEIRIPNRAATLTELAFHDTCDRDAVHLRDNFFRSAAMWGMYKGICQYFGTTPTWDIYSDELVSNTIPSTMNTGQTYNVSVTFRNRGVVWSNARSFRLGAVGDSDPFTATTRFNISGEIGPGSTYTFNFTMTAPATPGTYTTDWRMLRDGVTWFGATLTKQVMVSTGVPGCGGSDNNQGTPLNAHTVQWSGSPTSAANWASYTACGGPGYYTYGVPVNTGCTVFDRNLFWNAAPSWSGRGHFFTAVQVPETRAAVLAKYVMLNGANGDTATQPTVNQCLYSCNWITILDSDWTDLSTNGWRTNPNLGAAAPSGGCSTSCGVPALGAGTLQMYGDRWHYINDWACLGGYSSAAVADTHGFAESSLYLYPAIDRTHGDVFLWNGKAPGRVVTGDCNINNTLDFKGNASAYGGGDSMNSYAFAWAYAPAGAGPKYLIGSDDGNRLWVNGSLVNDNNASRGLTRDQDETASVSMPSGWSRILFKVHNGTGGFQGTVSLRNGSDRKWNEPSVNVFDEGGYYSYAIGYEQDWWYPCIDVATFYGASNPQTNNNYYGNNTTVTASGTAQANGPVPFWKVMHFEWGYGTGGDTNYADVTSSGNNWSHTAAGVTGHRRFHFFAVSQSHRTSFQNSGATGGWAWDDAGHGNYLDLYIDNVPPQDPAFTDVSASGATTIDLDWNLPLDQGVGIAAGEDEAADESGSAAANYYRCGDVGVFVRRDGAGIGDWGGADAITDTGLSPNTAYTYTIEARDNNSGLRGTWNNSTGQKGSVTRYTLSVPPDGGSVVPDKAGVCQGDDVVWTAVGGFGPGGVQYYRYAWNQNATYTFAGDEPQWSADTLTLQAQTTGAWYLHVQGYNAESVPNGAYSYSVTASTSVPPDFNTDCLVDQLDIQHFLDCATGAQGGPLAENCGNADLDIDGDVDQDDFGLLQRCISGSASALDPACWIP